MVKKTPWYSVFLALSPSAEVGLCAFGIGLSFAELFRKGTPAIAIAGIAALLHVVISRLGAIADQLRHLNGTIHAVIAEPGEDFISVADLKRLRRALGIETGG